MKLLEPGSELDGFTIEECVHSGGMAHIYHVHYTDGRAGPGFPMAMKIPRMTAGDGAENIVSFEVECQIMQALSGSAVPRFVAAGDLDRVPYLVMEYIEGRTLDHWLELQPRPAVNEISKLGAAMANAAHALHQQNAVHLDLKPANVLFRPDGRAVLLDFGLSCHAHYPDLLAEQLRKAVGSPTWIAPEQVVGVRGDPRSDIFAIGVMLYELATGELPFGSPQTPGGLRQRLWMDPAPLRKLNPDIPEWFQEVVLRCLEPVAAQRYPSAAHLAFDLINPDQVKVTQRGRKVEGTGFWVHFKRWLKAAGMHYEPSPLPSQQIEEVPIVLVAVPHHDVTDATLYSLREAVARSLGTRPGRPPGLRHRHFIECHQLIRRSQQRDQCAPAPHLGTAPVGTAAGPTRPRHLLPRAGVRRPGASHPRLRAWQPRKPHHHGCRHPWPENPALCRHRAHQSGHGRPLHRHFGQAELAV